jgi:hypothetical protein
LVMARDFVIAIVIVMQLNFALRVLRTGPRRRKPKPVTGE